MATQRVMQGDKAPSGQCVWKQMTKDEYAIKVGYTNDQGEQLYAVYTMHFPYSWPRDIEGELRATGEHLTLEQVAQRSAN